MSNKTPTCLIASVGFTTVGFMVICGCLALLISLASNNRHQKNIECTFEEKHGYVGDHIRTVKLCITQSGNEYMLESLSSDANASLRLLESGRSQLSFSTSSIVSDNIIRFDRLILSSIKVSKTDEEEDSNHPITQPENGRNVRKLQSDRQAKVWGKISTFDSFKTSPLYSGAKPTLTTFKQIIVPVWWSDEDTNDPNKRFDPNRISVAMTETKKWFSEMSWGKVALSYDQLPQQQIDVSKVSPGFRNTEAAARKIVAENGLVKHKDYNGVIMIYNGPDGGSIKGAYWANYGDSFNWYPGVSCFGCIKHELGHNFGHPHHHANSYKYREAKQLGDTPYDGFDMMSGGSGHLAAASKWFFNWIPDSSIILMQPEGATAECQSCLSSGTFTLRPFDDKNIPPTDSNKMGIHIPISVSGNQVYSYWFSYRSFNEKPSNGLSVHLAWFNLHGDFGAQYDSLNYDAFGDTETTNDSFVVEGSCYHVAPSIYLKDRVVLEDAEQVQPVVCVKSIDVGSSITVSVSFLDMNDIPEPQVSLDQEIILQCTSGGSSTGLKTLDANKYNMVHVKKTGGDGVVTWASSGNTQTPAFFYDK